MDQIRPSDATTAADGRTTRRRRAGRRSGGTRAVGDSLLSYRRILSKTPPLDVESELHHALELYRSRTKVASCVLALPAEIRGSMLSGDPDGPNRGARWPLDQVELCCNRLALCEVPSRDTELRQNLLEIKRQKRLLDQSRDTLIMASLRFVPHVAKNFSHPGISFMDLVQEGNVGLLKAVDRFDPRRGYRFSTYAYWWIRQAISKAVAEKSRVIRFPEHAMALVSRLKRTTGELAEELGRRPNTTEIAERMQVSSRRVDDLLAMILNPYPLDGPEGEFEEPEFLSNLVDPGAETPLESALNRERQEEIVAALNDLSPRERRIVNLRFGMDGGEGHTLDEIGAIVALSRERVRQILNEALGKMHDRGEIVLPVPRAADGAGQVASNEPGLSGERYTSVVGRGIAAEDLTRL